MISKFLEKQRMMEKEHFWRRAGVERHMRLVSMGITSKQMVLELRKESEGRDSVSFY